MTVVADLSNLLTKDSFYSKVMQDKWKEGGTPSHF